MDNKIKVISTIQTDKFVINFPYKEGELPLEDIEILLKGDIDLNNLVRILMKLIEEEKVLDFSFKDDNNLQFSDSKINLIKRTLEDIFNEFNQIIIKKEEFLTQTP